MEIEAAVAALVETARTRPPHEYWHASSTARDHLFRDPVRAAVSMRRALSDPSPVVRRYLARMLRDLKQTAPLRLLLADPDEEVRLEACGGLLGESLPPPHATVPLDVADELRRAVLDALHSLAPVKPYVIRDVIRLCLRLRDPDLGAFLSSKVHLAAWQSEAMWAMRYASDGGARLLAFLRDPSPALRSAACLAFVYSPPADQPDDVVRAALIERLDDDDEIAKRAVMALRNVPDASLEPRLLAMIPASQAVETLARWRSQAALPAILALARTGDHDAIKALLHYPISADIERAWLDVLASEATAYNKYVAADLVSQHGSSSAIPALEHFLANGANQLVKRFRKDLQRRLPVRIAVLREKPPLP